MIAGDETKNEAIIFQCMEEYHPDTEHPLQVQKLAVSLFESLHPLHNLTNDDRQFLSYAALLHDIGWAEGRKKHHKQSLEFILKDERFPFDRHERLMIGCIARYHRKAHPQPNHTYYCDLSNEDQQRVSSLDSLLRIADGLDYTHCSVIKEMRITFDNHAIHLHGYTDIPAPGEHYQALKKSRLFSEQFHREVHISWEII